MHRQNRWLIYILSNQTLTHNEHTVQLNVKCEMWKPYCMWCVSMNVCVPFSLWWMCNEVAEASIQQFSIYELLTLERRDLNITPSWNNSTSLTPCPPPPFLFVFPYQSFTRKANGPTWDLGRRGSRLSSQKSILWNDLLCFSYFFWCLTHGHQ